MPSFRSDENAHSEPFQGGCYSVPEKRDPLLMTYSEVETQVLKEYEFSKENIRGTLWG